MQIGTLVKNTKELHVINGVIPVGIVGTILEQETPIIGSFLVRFGEYPLVLIPKESFRPLNEEEIIQWNAIMGLTFNKISAINRL